MNTQSFLMGIIVGQLLSLVIAWMATSKWLNRVAYGFQSRILARRLKRATDRVKRAREHAEHLLNNI